jgi:glycosyltransferase involved in cell wall biosynthesis
MRILFIAPLPDPVTGQSLACQVFFERLALEHEVDVININKSSFKSGASSWGRALEVLSFVWQAFRRSHHADVIYFTISESVAGNLKDCLIYLACYRNLSRMAIHLHGGAGMRVLMHERPMIAALNKFFLSRLGAVILLGQRHLDIFRDLPRQPNIHLIPNFAQDYLFRTEAEINAKFDKQDKLKLLYLSNLIPGKGYLELLSAYEALDHDEQFKVELAFAGGFENKVDEAQFLQRIDGLANVSYHGVVGGERKARLLADAHMFCLPTYYPYEGQPISILEAYASGCAVLTTDHSGIFDVFDPAACGIAVEPRSPSAIAGAIRLSLKSGAALRHAGLHNRSLAERAYRVPTYNQRLVSVVEQLTRGHHAS